MQIYSNTNTLLTNLLTLQNQKNTSLVPRTRTKYESNKITRNQIQTKKRVKQIPRLKPKFSLLVRNTYYNKIYVNTNDLKIYSLYKPSTHNFSNILKTI